MKSIFTYLFLFCSVVVFAQKDFQGKAVYQSKTSFDMSRFNDREMSEQRKKQMMDRMKNMLEKTYILHFNKISSLYKEEEKLETPGQGGFRFGGMSGGTQYKNISEKKMIEAKEFFGKKFLITEEVEMPQWEMSGETKKIGNYTCYKATMIKKNDDFDWRSMRRRNDDKPKDSTKVIKVSDEIETPKETLVTAWYTPQIPVSNGPEKYWGLPGLILEINSDRTTILCTEVVLNPTEKVMIEAPTKGDKVTREEYNKIMKKKMEEMREMFRGRRDGGRGGR
ncbi:GLPGLI family protein [Tenacibaculum adriaticum]|uniref:GLPGLI family protein n=1 Tax=Tenacibaculum adriaticum TaxID=413713 RepID=A0A5S5DY16_9FLAO|nr:GLPGLI family protein [Tenacibaculum adriaticum]TYP99499.1 GLPGLI family protein [Tenacibaculum adriaticum]